MGTLPVDPPLPLQQLPRQTGTEPRPQQHQRRRHRSKVLRNQDYRKQLRRFWLHKNNPQDRRYFSETSGSRLQRIRYGGFLKHTGRNLRRLLLVITKMRRKRKRAVIQTRSWKGKDRRRKTNGCERSVWGLSKIPESAKGWYTSLSLIIAFNSGR